MIGSWVRAILVSVCALAGCNAVLGIEERTFDGGASADGGAAADGGADADAEAEITCEAYCKLVTDTCTGDFAVYATIKTCLGTCPLLALGSPGDTGNTVACRMKQAQSAADTLELGDHCPNAGPGGRDVCGNDCEFYCDNLAKVCAATVTIPDELKGSMCLDTCKTLNEADMNDTYSAKLDDNTPTRDCRILHLTNATDSVVPHCGHTIGGPGPCEPK